MRSTSGRLRNTDGIFIIQASAHLPHFSIPNHIHVKDTNLWSQYEVLEGFELQ